MLCVRAILAFVAISVLSSAALADVVNRQQRVVCTPELAGADPLTVMLGESNGTFIKDVKNYLIADEQYRVKMTLTACGDKKAKLVVNTSQRDAFSGAYKMHSMKDAEQKFDFSDAGVASYAANIRLMIPELSKVVVVCQVDWVSLNSTTDP